jgi:hypothetical protein
VINFRYAGANDVTDAVHQMAADPMPLNKRLLVGIADIGDRLFYAFTRVAIVAALEVEGDRIKKACLARRRGARGATGHGG